MVRTKAGVCFLSAMLFALVALPPLARCEEPAPEQYVEKLYDLSSVLTPRILTQFTGEPSAADKKRQLDDATQQVIDLIVLTVQPNSWKATGTGVGAITTVKNSRHVLVVHQTKAVHQEIADLLEQLTRLSDLQILYKVQEIELPAQGWQAFVKEHNYQREQPVVDAETIKTLLPQAQKKLSSQPSLAFNGEEIPLEIRPFETEGKTRVLKTTGTVVANLSGVRLTWSFGQLAEEPLSCNVPLNKSLLVELPYQTFADAPRSLALLTPVILLRSNAARGELTPVTEPLPLR